MGGTGSGNRGDVETLVSMPISTMHCADSLEANLPDVNGARQLDNGGGGPGGGGRQPAGQSRPAASVSTPTSGGTRRTRSTLCKGS